MDWAQVQSALQLVLKGVFVVDHRSTRAAERVRRTNAQGVSKLLRHLFPFQETLGRGLGRHWHVNFAHELAEGLPVLRDVDGLGVHPNHPHVVFFPNAHLLTLDGEVQCGLAAHRGQHRIDVRVLFEDVHNRLRLEWLEVDMVRDDRVGHDGRGIGIDEGHLDAFFLKASGRLASRVVEFAGLSNDDRSASNDQDRFDAVVFGHFFFIRSPFPSIKEGKRARTRRSNVVNRLRNYSKKCPRADCATPSFSTRNPRCDLCLDFALPCTPFKTHRSTFNIGIGKASGMFPTLKCRRSLSPFTASADPWRKWEITCHSTPLTPPCFLWALHTKTAAPCPPHLQGLPSLSPSRWNRPSPPGFANWRLGIVRFIFSAIRWADAWR